MLRVRGGPRRKPQDGASAFVEGGSFDLTPELGTFHLVAIGRAFHWMDRPRHADTARPDGRTGAAAVALFGDRHLDLPQNTWRKVL